MKELYNRILYVEDALLERLKKDPSNGLGRDLLFIRFFRIYFSQKVEPNADNWYPIQAEDYVTWQIKQFHKLKKNKKLAKIAPNPNKNLSSKFEDIDPIKITVSKYTCGFA